MDEQIKIYWSSEKDMRKINAIFMIGMMLVLTLGTATINATPRDRVESEIKTTLTVNCETLHQRVQDASDAVLYAKEIWEKSIIIYGYDSPQEEWARLNLEVFEDAFDVALNDYESQCS